MLAEEFEKKCSELWRAKSVIRLTLLNEKSLRARITELEYAIRNPRHLPGIMYPAPPAQGIPPWQLPYTKPAGSPPYPDPRFPWRIPPPNPWFSRPDIIC